MLASLKRAAVNATDTVLFVSAGVDAAKPLTAQNDSFWWGGTPFDSIVAPFNGFKRVVRGFDRTRSGLDIGAAEYIYGMLEEQKKWGGNGSSW